MQTPPIPPSVPKWLLLSGFWIFLPWPDLTAQDRAYRENLLQYRSPSGEIRAVETPADWELRRKEILAAMESVMGKFPVPARRDPVDVETVEEADLGTYVRRLITYRTEPDSGPDARTPAYLCIPKDVLAGSRRAPGILCLHPTDNTTGHGVVVGIGGRPNRQYAAELAGRGYVTIAPSYPQLAGYWPNLDALGYRSGSMKAIWDNSRSLDVLESIDQVDASRGFGAIGHSLGGHNAIYTAAFEPRIKAVVSSCGFDAYPDYYDGDAGVWLFGKGWCQTRYMPLLSNYRGQLDKIPFDFPELLGALAPRPVLVNAPLRDSNVRWRSVDRCADAARPVFRLLGREDSLVIRHPDCDHDFPDEQRAEAYTLFDSLYR